MPEIRNDSNNLAVVEDDRGTFDVQYGGRSGTPTVEIPVIDGNLVEVSCQFMARNPDGGFYYDLVATSSDATKLTRRQASAAQSSAGWQSFTRTDYFRITLPPGTGLDDATFEVKFEQDDLSNPGQAGAFILIAKVMGSLTL